MAAPPTDRGEGVLISNLQADKKRIAETLLAGIG